MLPLAIGLIGVGAAGTAYGMMKPRQKYNSPNYSDINLQKDNPELYAQLMKYEQMGKQLEALYNQRSSGPSMQEMRGRDQQLSDMRGSLGARGSLGGSTELLATQDLNRNFQDAVAQRMQQEQSALMQQRLAQGGQQYEMFHQGQGDIMNKLTNEAMMDYQSRMAQDQARNQFFSSLMGGGMGLAGSSMQANAVAKNTAALQQQNAMYNMQAQPAPMYQPAPVYAPAYNPAPSYYQNPYAPSGRVG